MYIFCINCGQDCAYSEKTSHKEISVRGIWFSYLEQSAFCTACGEEVYVPTINDGNVRRREEAYKKTRKIFAPPYQGYRREYIPNQSQTEMCHTSDPDEWRKDFPKNGELRFDKSSPTMLRHRSIKLGENPQKHKHDPQD